jgi:hypothetical protein
MDRVRTRSTKKVPTRIDKIKSHSVETGNRMVAISDRTGARAHVTTPPSFNERLVDLLEELSQVCPYQFATDPCGDTDTLIKKIRNVIDVLFQDTDRDKCVRLLGCGLASREPRQEASSHTQPEPSSRSFVPVESRPVGGRSASMPPHAGDNEAISHTAPEASSRADRGRSASISRALPQTSHMVGVSSLLQNLNDLCE